jgi:four helix bundle protein
MNNKINCFQDLIVWREGHNLVLMIYHATKKFPKDELYCLVNQARRAVISITSNVTEGFSRQSYREKVQFFYLALGSLNELYNQMIAAKDLDYLTKDEFDKIETQILSVQRLLNAFIAKTKTFIKKS